MRCFRLREPFSAMLHQMLAVARLLAGGNLADQRASPFIARSARRRSLSGSASHSPALLQLQPARACTRKRWSKQVGMAAMLRFKAASAMLVRRGFSSATRSVQSSALVAAPSLAMNSELDNALAAFSARQDELLSAQARRCAREAVAHMCFR
eukprot:2962351-Pleurochrysis_carterae.AAC.1